MHAVSPFTLCFAPKNNTPSRKTGRMRRDGQEFQGMAKQFMKRWGIDPGNLILIDNPEGHANARDKRRMREAVLDAIASHREEDTLETPRAIAVQFFCHGQKRGMQLGFTLNTVASLAEAVAGYGGCQVVSTLYACDCGRDVDRDRKDDLTEFGGDGGFADQYRDALCGAGAPWCKVDAHTTAGHTTRNPNVRRFLGMGSPVGGVGGFYIVPQPVKGNPDSRKLWTAWRAALRKKRGTFKFEFPFMTVAEIHAALLG